MCLIYFVGSKVLGPSTPSKCRTLTDNLVNSQSSMNSHKCDKAVSLQSPMYLIISNIASTTARLKSYPPSSRKTPERKLSIDGCFDGNFKHKALIASTTIILNSSLISNINPDICFINLSTEASLPVFNKVVIANVAIERLESVIKFSISKLHAATD